MTGAVSVLDTEVFTLLGVRRDGVASVVDLVADDVGAARRRAQALLKEHASCEAVELWRDGGLIEKLLRA
ncbi:hypothetical protein [Phenylobacterium sp.]|uniref:hypothetical protein n=1 Tax=Phenylobacterium sp. TaxID=1871053 RepID=UPI002DE8AE44|nr:hypothetical protein [Phenylobacterium sp.]